MNPLVEYIASNKNWKEDLSSDPFNIFIRESEDKGYENMYLFSYNMPKSNMDHPITQVCRGIILDLTDESNPIVVCYPFDKFFNYNEPNAHEIDWKSASIQEKVDGSIMKLWYNNNLRDWVWSTNGTVNAMNTDLPTDAGPFATFGELAADTFSNMFSQFPSNILDEGDTYIFELTSKWNRVVVPYAETELTLLGVRNNATGQEYSAQGYSNYFKVPKVYNFNSFEEMTEAAAALPFDEEGYVVCDANFNRVKVKSLAYLQVHHLADNGNVSKDRMLTLIRTGEDGELLEYYPEYTEVFDDVRAVWNNHLSKVEEIKVAAAKLSAETENRKEFALAVQKMPKQMHGYFFALLDGREDKLNDIMAKLTYDKLFTLDSEVSC